MLSNTIIKTLMYFTTWAFVILYLVKFEIFNPILYINCTSQCYNNFLIFSVKSSKNWYIKIYTKENHDYIPLHFLVNLKKYLNMVHNLKIIFTQNCNKSFSRNRKMFWQGFHYKWLWYSPIKLKLLKKLVISYCSLNNDILFMYKYSNL